MRKPTKQMLHICSQLGDIDYNELERLNDIGILYYLGMLHFIERMTSSNPHKPKGKRMKPTEEMLHICSQYGRIKYIEVSRLNAMGLLSYRGILNWIGKLNKRKRLPPPFYE